MKKLFVILLGLGLLFSAFPVYATEAADCEEYCNDPYDSVNNPGGLEMPTGQICYCNPLASKDLTAITDPIISFIFRLSIVVVPVLVLWGAFFIVTAAGDTERITKGKKIIMWTLIGFLIVLISQGISDLLDEILGV